MHRLALALCLSLAAATPAVAGPPWLTIEFRPNNFAGVMLLRTYNHGEGLAMPLTGTAEGVVNGQRRTVALTFNRAADAPNAYTVPNTWGVEGVWVLNISVTGDHLGAGAVVGLDRNGEPAFTRFPRTTVGASRPATSREVSAMLRALDANAPPGALGRTGWPPVLRAALPVLILIAVILGIAKVGAGLIARARRRTRTQSSPRNGESIGGATPNSQTHLETANDARAV